MYIIIKSHKLHLFKAFVSWSPLATTSPVHLVDDNWASKVLTSSLLLRDKNPHNSYSQYVCLQLCLDDTVNVFHSPSGTKEAQMVGIKMI